MSESNGHQLGTTFKDAADREWRVRLTIGLLGTVRRETGVELGKVLASAEGLGKFESEVVGDPEKFVTVLYLLCHDQAEKAGVTPEQFAEAIDGDTYRRAAEAMLGACSDFFRPPKTSGATKETLRTLLAKADDLMAETIRAKLNDLPTANGSAGNSPASPDSTPAN